MKKVIIFLSTIIVIESLGLFYYIKKYSDNTNKIKKLETEIKEILIDNETKEKNKQAYINKYVTPKREENKLEENNQDEPNEDKEDDEGECEYNYYKPEIKITNYAFGDYKIEVQQELDKNCQPSLYYRTGTITNIKTNKTWDILGMENDENIYIVGNNTIQYTADKMGVLNLKEKYVIEPKYEDVSCEWHSDDSYCTCYSSYTTIVDNSKLLSLKTGKILVEADAINEIYTGNFIAKKGNKRILYTSEGKELLKKDYIGYITYSVYDGLDVETTITGYLTFDNNIVKIYSDDLKEIELNLDKDKRYDVSDERMIWTSEDAIMNIDIKNNKYFKYTGSEYTGYQYIFVEDPCYGDSSVYVIDNNKLVKLNNIMIDEESELNGCF